MTFSFDLISDLHVETWPDFDWAGQATSPYCVVAGDVARDRDILINTLTHLGECYTGVFYIDGNEEHKNHLENLEESYQDLVKSINKIPNVIYMQNNVVIINGVAILATNGWWCYDFGSTSDFEQSLAWYRDHAQVSDSAARTITGVAYHDAAYLINSIRTLQTHQEVKEIVIVSHTLPAPWIIDHDVDLVDTWRFNSMGNQHLQLAIEEDTEHKIKTWCFGHYHKSVDQYRDGIRYINNPKGRGNTPWSQSVYYPKKIKIEF